MDVARDNRRFNWQQKGWPAATVDRTSLRGELVAAGMVEHRGSKKTGGYFAKKDNL